MTNRLVLTAALLSVSLFGLHSTATAATAADVVSKHDKDNDSTLDLNEVKMAASAHFDKLEKDNDGTLDKRELARRFSAKELAAADPDHDGTLSKEEYLAAVEQRFHAADPDNDGKLDAKELNSKAGRSLLRLLK